MFCSLIIALMMSLATPRLQLQPGIDGYCRQDGYLRVLATMRTGDQPFRGRLVIEFGSNLRIAEIRDNVPPHAIRRYSLNLPVLGALITMRSIDQSGTTSESKRERITIIRPQDILIAVVTETRVRIPELETQSISVDTSPLAQNQIIHLANIAPNSIGNALDLRPIDLMIVRSILDEKSELEIKKWVSLGGVLVMVGGYELKSIANLESTGEMPAADLDYVVQMRRIGAGCAVRMSIDPFVSDEMSGRRGIDWWIKLIETTRPTFKLARVYDPHHRFRKKVFALLRQDETRMIDRWLFAPVALVVAGCITCLRLSRRIGIVASVIFLLSVSIVSSVLIVAKANQQSNFNRQSSSIVRAYESMEIGEREEWIRFSSSVRNRKTVDLAGRMANVVSSRHADNRYTESGLVFSVGPFNDVVIESISLESLGTIEMKSGDDKTHLFNDSYPDLSDVVVHYGGRIGTVDFLAMGVSVDVPLEYELSRDSLLRLAGKFGRRKALLEAAINEGYLNHLFDPKGEPFLIGWFEDTSDLLIYHPF